MNAAVVAADRVRKSWRKGPGLTEQGLGLKSCDLGSRV